MTDPANPGCAQLFGAAEQHVHSMGDSEANQGAKGEGVVDKVKQAVSEEHQEDKEELTTTDFSNAASNLQVGKSDLS